MESSQVEYGSRMEESKTRKNVNQDCSISDIENEKKFLLHLKCYTIQITSQSYIRPLTNPCLTLYPITSPYHSRVCMCIRSKPYLIELKFIHSIQIIRKSSLSLENIFAFGIRLVYGNCHVFHRHHRFWVIILRKRILYWDDNL